MSTRSPRARRQLARATRERYLAASPADRRRILDELVALTGYHRKHAIRLLHARGALPRPRPRIYDDAVRDALARLWEAGDRVCGKRLVARLPSLVGALERRGELVLEASVRARVLAISAATVDRLLADTRAAARARARAPAPTAPPDRPPPSRARPARYWRTRADPLAAVWPTLSRWLEADPAQSAVALLHRLRAAGVALPERALRTLQRRLRAWRRTTRQPTQAIE